MRHAVDLARIETTLLTCRSVCDCTVLSRQSTNGEERLVCYIVLAERRPPEDLHRWIADLVGPLAVPFAAMQVSHLPRHRDGTVDTAALTALPVIGAAERDRLAQMLRSRPELGETDVWLTHADAARTRPATRHIAISSVGSGQASYRKDGAAPPAYCDGGPLPLPADGPTDLNHALLRTAELFPDKGIAFHSLSDAHPFLSYRGLTDSALRIAGGLKTHGMTPGAAALIPQADRRAYFTAFWGCLLAGVRPVTVSLPRRWCETDAVARKMRNVWELLDRPPVLAPQSLTTLPAARAWLTDTDWLALERLATHPGIDEVHHPRPDSTAFYQLTSGSTGTPKCIRESHRGLLAHVHGSRAANAYGSNDVTLNWLPYDHVVPLVTFHIKDVCLGIAQNVVSTEDILADPLSWLDLIEALQATHCWAPNFAFRLIVDALKAETAPRDRNLSSLRALMNAGEQVHLPVMAEFLHRTARFGLTANALQPAFGMAEGATCFTYGTGVKGARALPDRPETKTARDSAIPVFADLGPPMPGVEIRIADAAGATVSEGRIGRLQMRGAVVTQGYFRNPAANADAFVGDGWFNSGDLGFIQAGHLHVSGREKDVIIIHGTNHYCHEIEQVVADVAGVDPTCIAACGVPDADRGTDALTLFYVRMEGTTCRTEVIDRDIRACLARDMGLFADHVVALPRESFARTTSGKVQRSALKARWVAGDFGRSEDPFRPIEEDVPDTLLTPVWQPKALVHRRDSDHLSSSLVVFHAGEGRLSIQAIGGPGARHVELPEPAERAVPNGCLGRVRGRFDTVIYLLPAAESADTGDAAMLKAAIPRIADGLLSLLREMTRRRAALFASTTTLLLLTRHAVPGPRRTLSDPGPAMSAALAGIIEREFSWLRCRALALNDSNSSAALAALEAERTGLSSDNVVSYRNDRRYVRGLRAITAMASTQPPPFRQNGAYLVTGGLGGIGRRLARWLIETFGAQLLLTGTTDLSRRAAQRTPRVQDRDATLSDLRICDPTVLHARLDLTDRDALRSVVEAAEAKWGRRLDGIIHLAGTLEVQALLDTSPEDFLRAADGKAIGAANLAAYLSERGGGTFVGFSSVSSRLGGAGAGAYAAANAILENLLDQLADMPGITPYCYGWSAWRETGMSASITGDPLRASHGIRTLDEHVALDLLSRMSTLEERQVIAGLDPAHENVARFITGPPVSLVALTASCTAGDSVTCGATSRPPAHRDEFGIPVPYQLLHATSGAVAAQPSRNTLRDTDAGFDPALTSSPAYELVRSAWQATLRRPPSGPRDDFFAAGGDSLKSVALVGRIRAAASIPLELSELQDDFSFVGIARRVHDRLACGEQDESAAERSETTGPGGTTDRHRLSFSQESLWRYQMGHPDSFLFNMPMPVRLRGPLDTDALACALAAVMRRHAMLRSCYRAVAGVPERVTLSDEATGLKIEDIADLDEPGIDLLLDGEAQRPFDLAAQPPCRIRLLRRSAIDHILLLTTHHIAFDGWSYDLFFGDLTKFYAAAVSRTPMPESASTADFGEYVRWQRAFVGSRAATRQVDYWRTQLAEEDMAVVPRDRPWTPVETPRGRYLPFELTADLVASMRRTCQEAAVSLFVLCAAALMVALGGLGNNRRVSLGTVVANRRLPSFEETVGFFVNAVVLTADLTDRQSFADLLQTTRRRMFDALDHQDLPFGELIAAIGRPPPPGRDNPFYQGMLVIQSDPLAQLALKDIAASRARTGFDVARSEFVVEIETRGDTLVAGIYFDRNLYEDSTMGGLAKAFCTVLELATADCAVSLNALLASLARGEAPRPARAC